MKPLIRLPNGQIHFFNLLLKLPPPAGVNFFIFIKISRIMFSKTAEYALRATIFIAQKSSPLVKIGIDEISGAIDSPKPFTAKILQMLTKDNRVVSSSRGPHGGFYITDAARNLPAISVLQAVKEDYILRKCILGLHECSNVNPCPLHAEYKEIRNKLVLLFENNTIGYLANEIDKENIFINNVHKLISIDPS